MDNITKFKSRREMVFSNFNNNHKFLPTPNQILLGIIKAQINEFMSGKFEHKSNFVPIITCHTEIWKKIFSLSEKVNMDLPLTPQILSNQSHGFVKTLIYVYSMQSFIFSQMNKASRQKDVSMIDYYGPLASALGFIIHCGNKVKGDTCD